MKKLLLLIVPLIVLSCQTKQNYRYRPASNQYAKGFELESGDKYDKITVFSPWKAGDTLALYYLIREENTATPSDGIRIKIPIKRLTTTSCTQIGFLSELGEIGSVSGVCNPYIVYNHDLQEAVNAGAVADVGDAMTPNVELILRSAPDAVMVSTSAQGDAATEKLLSLGAKVIFNNEWTENDPLARAEWLRFTAAFFDKLPLADSIFQQEVEKYNNLKNIVATTNPKKKSIMSGNNFRGTWYVPAGNTYMGVLFRDADAKYFYEKDSSLFSIPLNIETVVRNFADADVWVGAAANSLDELRTKDKKHTWFNAYRTKQVYNFYARTTAMGGNDFWETGVVHPALILQDIINILYPDILEDKELYFAKQLE